MASVGVKLGVKLPMWVCHDRSVCGKFSVGVAWHQWVCLGLSECGMGSMIVALPTGFCIASLGVELPHWVWHTLDGSGML